MQAEWHFVRTEIITSQQRLNSQWNCAIYTTQHNTDNTLSEGYIQTLPLANAGTKSVIQRSISKLCLILNS